MKTFFLILCILFFLINPSGQSEADNNTLTVGFVDWDPLIDTSNIDHSFIPEMIYMGFLHQNYKPKFVTFSNWTECYKAVVNGAIDCSAPYLKSETRMSEVLFSDHELITLRSALFIIKGSELDKKITSSEISIDEISDLSRSYTIIAMEGYYYGKGLDNAHINFSDDPKQAYYSLYLSKIDGVLDNELTGWNLISSYFPRQRRLFSMHHLSAESTNAFLICNKHAKPLTKIFDRGIDHLKKNNIHHKLIRKYKPTL